MKSLESWKPKTKKPSPKNVISAQAPISSLAVGGLEAFKEGFKEGFNSVTKQDVKKGTGLPARKKLFMGKKRDSDHRSIEPDAIPGSSQRNPFLSPAEEQDLQQRVGEVIAGRPAWDGTPGLSSYPLGYQVEKAPAEPAERIFDGSETVAQKSPEDISVASSSASYQTALSPANTGGDLAEDLGADTPLATPAVPEGRVSDVSSRPAPSVASVSPLSSRAPSPAPQSARSGGANTVRSMAKTIPCPDCRGYYDVELDKAAVQVEDLLFQSEEKDAEIARLRGLVGGKGAAPQDEARRREEELEAALHAQDEHVRRLTAELDAARRAEGSRLAHEASERDNAERQLESAVRERDAEIKRLQAELVERAVREENERNDRLAQFGAEQNQLKDEIQALKAGGASLIFKQALQQQHADSMAQLQALHEAELEQLGQLRAVTSREAQGLRQELEQERALAAKKDQDLRDAAADKGRESEKLRAEVQKARAAVRERDETVQKLSARVERLRARAQERVDKAPSPPLPDQLPDSELVTRWKQVAWKVRQVVEKHRAGPSAGQLSQGDESKVVVDLVNWGAMPPGPADNRFYTRSPLPAPILQRLGEAAVWTVLATWVFSSPGRISCLSRAVGRGLGGPLVKLSEHILKDFKDAKAFHQWRAQTAALLSLDGTEHFAFRVERVVEELQKRAETLLSGWDGPLKTALADVVGDAMRLDIDLSRQRAWFCCFYPGAQPGQEGIAVDLNSMEIDGEPGRHVALMVRPALTKVGNARGENYEQVVVVDKSLVCCSPG